MNNFREGDIVKLKSGGPPMTVGKVTEKYITCHWFVPEQFFHGIYEKTFTEATLTRVEGVEK